MELYCFGDPRLPERFWTKVDPHGPIPAHAPELGPCWVWTGANSGNDPDQRYGRYQHEGRVQGAHRVVFKVLVGLDVPEVDHICRNHACVRPTHLRALTHQQNVLVGVAPPAANAVKTHCPAEHEYTPENTYVNPTTGRRHCRKCKAIRESDPNYRAKQAVYMAAYQAARRKPPGQRRRRPSRLPAEVLRLIMTLHERGESFTPIARRLNAEGIPTATGRAWTASSVQSALCLKVAATFRTQSPGTNRPELRTARPASSTIPG